MRFGDDKARDFPGRVVLGDHRNRTRMVEVEAQFHAGISDARAETLPIDSKKGVEIGSLDAPEPNHISLSLCLGQPRSLWLLWGDHHPIVERSGDQPAGNRMHHADIPAGIPPLPFLVAGIERKHQGGTA